MNDYELERHYHKDNFEADREEEIEDIEILEE